MLTQLPDGTPYGLEDLVNALAVRVETLSELAEMVVMRKSAGHDAKTLSAAISHLRDDFDVFENALRDWDEREHPEDYADEPTPTKGRAR
jgi:hypothetical protein